MKLEELIYSTRYLLLFLIIFLVYDIKKELRYQYECKESYHYGRVCVKLIDDGDRIVGMEYMYINVHM
jgi:hypothetical protein